MTTHIDRFSVGIEPLIERAEAFLQHELGAVPADARARLLEAGVDLATYERDLRDAIRDARAAVAQRALDEPTASARRASAQQVADEVVTWAQALGKRLRYSTAKGALPDLARASLRAELRKLRRGRAKGARRLLDALLSDPLLTYLDVLGARAAVEPWRDRLHELEPTRLESPKESARLALRAVCQRAEGAVRSAS